jgi:hypothetical protein
LIHQVWERLKPACWPVYTSGGLNQYFYALTAHFGEWGKPPRARKYHWVVDARLKYAQLRKRRQGRTVTFLYSIICLGVRETIRAALQSLGFTGRIQTAYVERANLTLHIYWELAYYHFIRPHQSLEQRVRSPGQPRYRTPAMAAGLTRRRRTVAELLMTPVPETGELAPFPVI